MTQDEKQDLAVELQVFSKKIYDIEEEIRVLDNTDTLYIMDVFGTNGDLCVSFDKDVEVELRNFIKVYLRSKKREAIRKILENALNLSGKEIDQ